MAGEQDYTFSSSTRHSKRALWKDEKLGFVEKEQGEVYSGSRKDVQGGNLQVLTTSFAKPNQAGTKTNVVRQQLWPGLCRRPSFLQSA